MSLWALFLEAVRVGLFATTHVLGGSVGAGILVFAAAVRIAMLPITFRNAKRTYARTLAMARLAPEISALRTRYKSDPRKMNEAIFQLYADNGISMTAGMGQMLVQAPIAMAMWRTITTNIGASTAFLWIRNLAKPDVGVAIIAAGVTGVVTSLLGANPQQQQRVMMVISMSLTFFFAWRMSAGIALYSIAWSGVSAGEAAVIRLRARHQSA